MRRAVYILSDLHLGADPELDDFLSDDAFDGFLRKIESDVAGAPVTLVLLGDTIDLWQIVPPGDKRATATKEIDLDLSPQAECGKIQRAAARHPKVFEGLKRFVRTDPANRCLVIVPGNHDHSLVEGSVRDCLRTILEMNQAPASAALKFSSSYDDPEMGIYAEHGNQYDGKNNVYGDFDHFRPVEECAGYYFVRLFWNRFEPLAPRIDNIYPGRPWEIFRWLLQSRRFSLLVPALMYFQQYRGDARVPKYIDVAGVPFFAAGLRPSVLPGMPERLLDPGASGPPYFSDDATTEHEYLRIYRDDPEARKEMLALWPWKLGIPPDPPTLPRMSNFATATAFAAQRDPCLEAVEKMFAGSPKTVKPCFRATPLDRSVYRYVVLGHTHEKQRLEIAGVDHAKYINTGSWIARMTASGSPISQRYYLAISQDDSGVISEKFEPYGE